MAATRKKPEPIQPFVPTPGEKPMLSEENQVRFIEWYQSKPQTHQSTIRELLSMVVNVPFLNEGYKKQARFYRRFLKDRPAEVNF